MLSETQWHALFDRQRILPARLVREQFHVRTRSELPNDPLVAYAVVEGKAKNVEAKIAGSAIIGDNLGAIELPRKPTPFMRGSCSYFLERRASFRPLC